MSRKKINISDLNLKKIGGRVAYIRIKNGLNQEEFGKKIGITKSNVSSIENHLYEPSYQPIVQIIEKFKLNPVWFLIGEGDPVLSRENGWVEENQPLYEGASPENRMASDPKPPEYEPHGGWKPQTDPKGWEMLGKVHAILTSGGIYARALAANIDAFHQAIEMVDQLNAINEKYENILNRINDLFNINANLSEKVIHLETRIKKSTQIRETDPEEQKEALLKKRA